MCLIILVFPSHSLPYLPQPLHSSIHSHLHIKSLYPFTHHPHLSDYLTSTILTGSQKWQHDGNIKPKNYTQISWHLLPCFSIELVWFTLKPFSFRNCKQILQIIAKKWQTSIKFNIKLSWKTGIVFPGKNVLQESVLFIYFDSIW